MSIITVPIIAQSTTTPPVFYGMIGSLRLHLDDDNTFLDGTVSFTKPQALVPKSPYNISQVGTTPVLQNGNLQFQLVDAVSVYATDLPKSKPPFTFTGQIDLNALTISGQAAWLPRGLITSLPQTSTSASGNFTQSTPTFSNPHPSVLSLSQWPNSEYTDNWGGATGLTTATGSFCELQLDNVPNNVPADMTIYLYIQGGLYMPGGTSNCPISLSVWQSVPNQPPSPATFVTGFEPPSSGFGWYAFVVPQNFLKAGTNYITIVNGGTEVSAAVYIKNVVVVW